MIKILFLAANPLNTTRLKLDEEIRGIDEKLRQTEFRDQFEINQHWVVRIADLQGLLLRHKPDIVHISGHGSPSCEIMLEDNAGFSRPVPVHALSRLFAILKGHIHGLVLNACYSERQARAIAEHIEFVVGMSKSITDAAAISFAGAFYQALGYGEEVKTAFDLACAQIALENLNEEDTPKLSGRAIHFKMSEKVTHRTSRNRRASENSASGQQTIQQVLADQSSRVEDITQQMQGEGKQIVQARRGSAVKGVKQSKQ